MYYEITNFPNFCPCCGQEFKVFWVKQYKKVFKAHGLIRCPMCQAGFRKLNEDKNKIVPPLIVPNQKNLDK